MQKLVFHIRSESKTVLKKIGKERKKRKPYLHGAKSKLFIKKLAESVVYTSLMEVRKVRSYNSRIAKNGW